MKYSKLKSGDRFWIGKGFTLCVTPQGTILFARKNKTMITIDRTVPRVLIGAVVLSTLCYVFMKVTP